MGNKSTAVNAPFLAIKLYNDSTPETAFIQAMDAAIDRLATAGRRAFPLNLNRGRDKDYDFYNTSDWKLPVRVPPYTKAVGIRAWGALQPDSSDTVANAAFYYRWAGEAAWGRRLIFEPGAQGKDPDALEDWTYLVPVETMGTANPDNDDIIAQPLPVTASDEPQDLYIELYMDTSLTTWYVYAIQIWLIPYDNDVYPTV